MTHQASFISRRRVSTEQGCRTGFISWATLIHRFEAFSRLSRVECCDRLAMSAMGVKLRRDIHFARCVPSLSYILRLMLYKVSALMTGLLMKLNSELTLLSCLFWQGLEGRWYPWKLLKLMGRLAVLNGSWGATSGWQVAALCLLRGGLQATLGFFSRDNPQFYTMARLTGPGKILQLQFLVTPEPQKTSVTVFQKQLFWDSRAHLSIQQGKCFVKYIAK